MSVGGASNPSVAINTMGSGFFTGTRDQRPSHLGGHSNLLMDGKHTRAAHSETTFYYVLAYEWQCAEWLALHR